MALRGDFMISDKIKEVREKNKLNKREMAKKLEVPYTTYNNYETGAREPGSNFLINFSKVFNVTVDYLVGASADPIMGIEGQKKNDILSDIILRLRSDNNFLEVVKGLYESNDEQINAIKSLLITFK